MRNSLNYNIGSPAPKKSQSLSPQRPKFQKSNSLQMSPLGLAKVEEEQVQDVKSSKTSEVGDPFDDKGTEDYPTIVQNESSFPQNRKESTISKDV